MASVLASTVVKAALPAAAIAIIRVVARLRGLSWRDNLGLGHPRAPVFAVWLGAWIAWIVASEVLIRIFHLADAEPWPPYEPLVLALRVLAIGILGPIAEELVMRGILFDRVRRTRLGPYGAIVVLSVAWAVMHYRYGAGTLALVFADGLVFGFARYLGGSLWIPIAMHVLGNLISIVQSLAA